MPTSKARLALAFTAIVAFASWPALRPSAAETAPPPAPTRDCHSRGESRQPATFDLRVHDLRLGPLILSGAKGWTKKLTAGEASREWPYVAKIGLRLRAGTKAVLAVADRATELAALSHHNRWVFAVRFEACPSGTPAFAYRGTVGPVTGFPFAFALKRPSACVPLELWIEGRRSPLRTVLPLGRRRC